MFNFIENMEKYFDRLEIGQDEEDSLDHEKLPLMQDDDLGILVAFESIDRLLPEQKTHQFNQFQHALKYNRSSATLRYSHVNPNLSSQI